MNQHDWRNLFINVARRERSSSITAVNFSASPLPGSTRLTTASALICPSYKKVQIDWATQASWRWSLYKQATQTHVPNS